MVFYCLLQGLPPLPGLVPGTLQRLQQVRQSAQAAEDLQQVRRQQAQASQQEHRQLLEEIAQLRHQLAVAEQRCTQLSAEVAELTAVGIEREAVWQRLAADALTAGRRQLDAETAAVAQLARVQNESADVQLQLKQRMDALVQGASHASSSRAPGMLQQAAGATGAGRGGGAPGNQPAHQVLRKGFTSVDTWRPRVLTDATNQSQPASAWPVTAGNEVQQSGDRAHVLVQATLLQLKPLSDAAAAAAGDAQVYVMIGHALDVFMATDVLGKEGCCKILSSIRQCQYWIDRSSDDGVLIKWNKSEYKSVLPDKNLNMLPETATFVRMDAFKCLLYKMHAHASNGRKNDSIPEEVMKAIDGACDEICAGVDLPADQWKESFWVRHTAAKP